MGLPLAIVLLAIATVARAEAPAEPPLVLNIPYVEDPAKGLVTLQTQHLELLVRLIQTQTEAIRRLEARPPVRGECI